VTLTPAKSQSASATTAAPTTPKSVPASPVAQSNPAPVPLAANPPPSPAPRRYFAIIDASHGGDDRGEALSNSLAEKDVTLAFARSLRQELESRGLTTLMLRDSDANLALDDRAFSANSSHAAIYIVLHAASSGHGVRLYTTMLPYSQTDDRGPFRAWTTAQSPSIALSQAAAASVADTLKKVQLPVRILTAPLRPLNNVVIAALAVEVAPPASDVSALNSPDYQQLVAGAVANGILAARASLEAAP
jgi:N-acetylmuramoyl-L-alanine amidase